MHVIGGYAAQKVARPYHHVFDARNDAWRQAAPIPRGANHIGVAALDGFVYACGGFVEQNRVPVPDCWAHSVSEDRWRPIRPLQRGARGAISVVAFGGTIHAIGGRDTRSIDWHEVYEPQSDSWRSLAPMQVAYDPARDLWEERAPMPTPRSGHGGVFR